VQAKWRRSECGGEDGDRDDGQVGATHLSAVHVFGFGAKRDARTCTGVRIWKGRTASAFDGRYRADMGAIELMD
jgi:hypothetical protein